MPTSFQRSFVGGIITQPNLNRKDTAKVASGLRDIENGWVLPGGAFESRPGTRWITTTKDQGDHVRIRRFFFNDAQAYALEFGAHYIRLYQLSAQAYANATIVEPDPFLIALAPLYPSSTADDLAALTGTLPSATATASEGLLELRLSETASGTTTRTCIGPSGTRTSVHVYSSFSGFPGATLYWSDTALTMTVKVTGIAVAGGGTFLFANMLTRLHRTSSGGAGQERIKALGVALGDPTSVTVPGGGAGVMTSIGVDLLAGGVGTYTFTWALTSGMWGNSGAAISATDRFTAEIITIFNANNTVTIAYDINSLNTTIGFPQAAPNQPGVPWNPASNYQPGDVVFTGTGPLVYYYAVAHSLNKNPDTVIYQNDFWYLLPNAAVSTPILEIPTPYTAEDVPDVVQSLVQSGDTISITHENYPPHELIRHLDDIYSFGRWTCLPVGFKPQTTAPTDITVTDPGVAGAKTIRYKVTAVDLETGTESAAGGVAATSVGTMPENPVTNSDKDILVTDVGHGLIDGSEIYISLITTTSSDRANENAKIALEGTTWTVKVIDVDNFRINGTAGLLTYPAITSVAEGYPFFTVTYALAYVELVNKLVPRGTGGTRVEFGWDEVPGAKYYFIYRTIIGQEAWGFLNSTTELTYADEGDVETAGVAAVVDTTNTAPDYRSPFRYGLWPRASAYHAQRQWFGGTTNAPLRVWGSVTGDFRNFSTRTPTIASDSLDFVIASEGSNEVVSIATLGVLLIFTTGAVWTLPGNLDGVISATEPPNLQTVTYEGSGRVRPVVVGDSALFLRFPGNSVLREARFDARGGTASAYGGRDLTLYAPELFKGFSMIDLARMSIPNSIIFAVRSDGQMLGLTYIFEQDVWGWHRHTTRPATDIFQSICTVPEDGADALYCIVRRSIDGTDTWYVERMDQRRLGENGVDDRLAMYFLDSGMTFDGTNESAITLTLTPPGSPTWLAGATGYTLTASAALFPGNTSNVGNGYRLRGAQILDGHNAPTGAYDEVEVRVTTDASTTVQTVTLLTAAPVSTRSTAILAWVGMVDQIDGLDHLEGESIMVLADGNILGPYTVASGTVAAFSRPYGIIHAGLPIETAFQALSIDTGDESAIPAAKKRVTQAAVFLHDSYRPSIGPNGGTLYPLPKEHNDTDTNLLNEPRVARVEGRWSREGLVEIRQSNPVPLSVTALLLEYEAGGF